MTEPSVTEKRAHAKVQVDRQKAVASAFAKRVQQASPTSLFDLGIFQVCLT